MRYDFAPMEGLTDSVYRRLHHKYFGGVDRYFMPFLSPTIHRTLTHKEDRELPMADSVPFQAVPQILTKAAEDFLWAAQVCADRGYVEVNLNTGCPSGTVVAKGKGSGMLRDLSELDRFLNKIFSESPLPISVKTRLGLLEPEEFAPESSFTTAPSTPAGSIMPLKTVKILFATMGIFAQNPKFPNFPINTPSCIAS